MKCPYRFVTSSRATAAITVEETEEFAECYGDGCPFFEPSSQWQCLRAKAEYKGAVPQEDE